MCECVRHARVPGWKSGEVSLASWYGSDLLYLIHRASSAALCSPVQDAEHSDCILESPELLLSK